MTCNVCLNLQSGKALGNNEYIIHQTFSEIKISAERNCSICACLVNGIEQSNIKSRIGRPDFEIQCRIYVTIGKGVRVCLGAHQSHNLEDELEFYSLPDIPTNFSTFGCASDVPDQMTLSIATQNIENWLKNCGQNHRACNTLSSYSTGLLPYLPHRVLDVGLQDSSFAARLIEANGTYGRYATLSHCWGADSSSTITTTSLSLEERKLGIRWNQLPATFRDAILITRKLGIAYLWIDSLCIIQEDESDWERESATMASVYSNCYLNLAATHAKNSTGGCFSKRWIPSQPVPNQKEGFLQRKPTSSCAISLEGKVTGVFVRSSRRVAHAQCTSDLGHDFPLDETAPLLGRAWCYQERLLSPRTVHFHSSEMVWHCIEAVRCECKALDDTQIEATYAGRATFPKYAFNFDMHINSLHLHWYLWLNIIHQYSKLALTDPSDKLPALSGVALSFQQKTNPGKYLAGLWEFYLPACLLWQVYSNPDLNPSRIYADTYRALPYRAPSWSWACIEFDQTYRSAVSYYDVVSDGLDVDTDFAVINATSIPAGTNEFGHVKEGLLSVMSHVLTGLVDMGRSIVRFKILPDSISAENGLPEGETTWEEQVNLDCIQGVSKDFNEGVGIDTVYCLLVGQFVATGLGAAIVIRPSKSHLGKFERIGLMSIQNHLESFQNANTSVMDII